ncbi:MAG: nicotinate phosphoribosyltransferase [Ktedonobacterales bacterium]
MESNGTPGAQGPVLRRAPGHHPGLLTDMYHPDAAYVSWVAGRNGLATFDLYTRSAPFGGAYLLVAGLEAALEFVQSFRYSEAELAFLAHIRDYDATFLDELATLRFTGDIAALPEGSIAFPNEPLLRVTAPFREALLMEAGLLQAINLATLIATKAARIVWAADQRRVSEFAFRRAQNPLVVARSSFIGGCSSTSLLAAAFEYRLLATGTVPHALIQLFPDEEAAFTAVAESFNRYTLLLDTYDPRHAIHTAIAVAQRTQDRLGHTLAAVRLDSGDLVADSRYVREQLRQADMAQVRILASGDLDEFEIVDLLAAGAEVDAFGVGTALGVGAGNVAQGVNGATLGGVYKEVWYVEDDGAGTAKLKLAGAKTTWPGRKELYRHPRWEEDVIALESEPAPTGYQRLLRPVMRQGRIIPGSLPPLSEVWELAQANLRALPDPYHELKASQPYPVRSSAALQALQTEAIQSLHAQQTAQAAPAVDGQAGEDHQHQRQTRRASHNSSALPMPDGVVEGIEG